MPVAREQATEPAMTLTTTTTSSSSSYTLRLRHTSRHRLGDSASERPAPRILMRILLPFVHLLPKLLCLLLISKAQPEQTFLALEAVEESPVLVILESVVDLLVPDDAAVRAADVDQLDPERVAHQVVGEDGGTLQAGVGPSLRVGQGDVELSNGNCVDFVARFGDGALDGLLVVV